MNKILNKDTLTAAAVTLVVLFLLNRTPVGKVLTPVIGPKATA
jgi:hypothetical protein